MAAKKSTRAKSRKNVTRAKATRKSSVRSARKAPDDSVPGRVMKGPPVFGTW